MIGEIPSQWNFAYTGIKNINLSNITYLPDGAFYACYSLESCSLPNVVSVGRTPFAYCSSLQSITLFISNKTASYDGILVNCQNLTTINLPNLTEISKGSICSSCANVVNLSVPELTYAGEYAFNGLGLSIINLPKISYLSRPFGNGSPSLSTIILGGSSVCVYNVYKYAGRTDFGMPAPFLSNGTGGTLYVPQSLITAYQSATNWAAVLAANPNNQVLPIEGSPFDPNNQE